MGEKDYELDQHIEGLAKSLTKLGFHVVTKGETFKHIAQKNDIKFDPDGTIFQGVDNNGRTKI